MVLAVTPWSAGLEAPAGTALVASMAPTTVTRAAMLESDLRVLVHHAAEALRSPP